MVNCAVRKIINVTIFTFRGYIGRHLTDQFNLIVNANYYIYIYTALHFYNRYSSIVEDKKLYITIFRKLHIYIYRVLLN